jgi:RNA 2',3'-cyclic 3'-phosphodiesterase
MTADPKQRLFVAVDLPDAVRRPIEEAVAPLRAVEGLRWVRPDALHLTLAFLGWVEPALIDPIGQRLSAVASAAASFPTHLTTLGRFPDRGKARIVWVGVDDPEERLTALAGSVGDALRDITEVEDRPFRAHVTVARAKVPITLALPEAPVRAPGFAVDAIALFRSHLRREGARYESLARWRLGASIP